MKFKKLLGVAAIGFGATTSAHSATLNFSATADNAFSVYLSTNDAVRGNLVFSNVGGIHSQWQQGFNFSTSLSSPIYFVHIIGTNYNNANGLFPADGTLNGSGPNPNAFLADLSLSVGGYVFAANGSTSLSTNSLPGEWLGRMAPDNANWLQPSSTVQDFGANGGSNIWTGALGGPVPGISTSAFWIWSNPDNGSYADISTEIICRECAPTVTPLPAALPLFAGGLGVIGLLARRRKLRAASLAA